MRRAAPILLLLASVLVHWPAADPDFAYDDRDLVERSRSADSLAGGLAGFGLPFPPDQPERALYRPLTNLSYAVDHALFGENAFGFHVTNVLLYAAAVLLVHLLARLSLGSEAFALAAALLFSLHPVHCDAVDSIAGRSEILALGFALAALLLFLRAVGDARPAARGTLLASAAFYALACLSKESGAVWIFVLAAYRLVWPTPPRDADASGWLRALRPLLPHAAVLLAYLLLRFAVLGRFSPDAAILRDADAWTRLLVMGSVFSVDLALLVFPSVLQIDFYYQDLVGLPEQLTVRALFGWLAAAALLSAAAALARRHFAQRDAADGGHERAAALGAFAIFFATLLPTSHLLDIGALAAERFLFAPSLGFVLLLVLAFRHALYRWIRAGVQRPLAAALLVGLCLAGAARSHARAGEWRDEVRLWQAAVARLPQDPRSRVNLGEAHLRRGALDPARAQLEEALTIEPDYFPALGNLAIVALEEGRLDEAETLLRRLLERNPQDALSWYNLAVVEQRRDQPELAVRHLRQALAIDPQFALARRALEQLPESARGTDQEPR